MEIKIWGDFACPFCYMGETQLDETINALGKKDDVTIRFMAYQLDPEAPQSPEETMTQHFMSEHKETEEEALAQMDHITRMASRARLKLNLAGVKVCNTLDAHRLMKYACQIYSKDTVLALNFALFRANFVDNLRLSDKEVLLSIAEECGLDRNQTEAVLNSDAYADQVKEEAALLKDRKDFDYIPFMEFEDGTVLQGVVSPGALKKAIV